MLLGLLVLLVAVLLSTMIAVLSWKKRNLEADVKEIQLCTAILERAERSKSEAVASTSHELRTPIIGMMGMIEELLDSSLEEWQHEDMRVARACAGETVELINRVLDLAKLQAGRLQLETLPPLLPAPHPAGHIAIRLWCIPPPHATSTSPSPATAATGSTEPPLAASAWHQLAGCVRRFPPATCLLCLPQHCRAKQGGPVGNRGGWACSRDGMGSAVKREGGVGQLEEEVRE
ncbi:unnamed protein product [Closterium sp. Naga37s-1]|nr:unnamed protein product [Closterium sp. Naga37s-1]